MSGTVTQIRESMGASDEVLSKSLNELTRELNAIDSRYLPKLLQVCEAQIRSERPELLSNYAELEHAMLELVWLHVRYRSESAITGLYEWLADKKRQM